MNRAKKINIVRRSLLTLLSGSALLLASCNMGDLAGLKVAGGTIDGAGEAAKYPATVYVELKGKDFNNQQAIIRNVGTIVDVGLPDSYAIILSLADVFQAQDGVATLPMMKQLDIKLYLSSGKEAINLPGVKIKNGRLEDDNGNRYFMYTVGVKIEPKGQPSPQERDVVSQMAPKLFRESPLITEHGGNIRDANTSYVMLAVPKKALPSIRVPGVMTAEGRPAPASLKGVVVGFGENTVGGSRKSDFSLAAELPSVMKRNYADIDALNATPAEYTPLRQLIGSSTVVSQQIWEFTGSGLCGSKDGSNYDTGAAVYVDGKFAGFGVRSTAKSAGFKGRLDCAATKRDDMVTLVVSPSKEDIEAFKSSFGQVR